MAGRVFQLVLHYDGGGFAGWQVQPAKRTVQGVLESALSGLCNKLVPVMGAGRTDAGVHARGQSAGVCVPEHWTAERLRHVLNGRLPSDIWVERTSEMHVGFHARFSATGRRYSYAVGLDETARSPFRNRWESPCERALDRDALDWCAARTVGTHRFLAFSVRGTAPATDAHHCDVRVCQWRPTPGGLLMEIEANRFLHHMVRFLVGTMLDVATGRRSRTEYDALLLAESNSDVSPPASPAGLCLEHVSYPDALYLNA